MDSKHNDTTRSESEEVISRGLVLIADDERLNRAALRLLLTSQGFDVVEAENGLEALDVIRKQTVDLVLLDIMMPEMDGLEFLARKRQEMPDQDVPVLMVTANDRTDQVIKAFQLGANDYINKPFDPAVTLARISMHLQFAQSRADLRKSEERYSLVAKGTRDGLWDWDVAKDEIFFSQRWYSMFDIEPVETPTPDIWFSRVHSEDLPAFLEKLKSHFSGRSAHLETEMRMRHQDGNYRWMLCRGQAVINPQGKATRIAGSLTDITEGKVADALTSLPNRVLFHERLTRCIYRQKRDPDKTFSLLYLDLDNFKLVNDSLGHEAGDRLLVTLSRRLENCLRESDSIIYRLGGDEFAILIEGVSSLDAPVHVANRIIASTDEPIGLGQDQEVFTSVSVGIVFSGSTPLEAKEMVQAADTAMYQAKALGKSRYCVFEPVMREDAVKRLNIGNELRHAIDRGDLHCHFQPIIDIATRRVSGVETLVRWTHEELGRISPAEFIPIAEENGLIEKIGLVVFRQACMQLVSWRQASPRFNEMIVNVNLSSRQLRCSNLIDQIFDIVDESHVDPANIKFEVTESTIMDNPERGAKVLSLLQYRGFKIAIDDFGTGYSSLSCIHELSPDVVKIDRSFVDEIQTSKDKETIVRAIIALADGLKLDVVAEGIETETQHEILLGMGCEFAQGYLYSKPLPPDELFAFVMEQENSNAATTGAPGLTVPAAASLAVPELPTVSPVPSNNPSAT